MRILYSIIRELIVKSDENPQVFNFYNISDAEKKEIIQTFAIDDHSISSSLDPEEVSRFEKTDSGYNIIIKVPTSFAISNGQSFTVKSIGIFIRNTQMIIISDDKIEYLNKKPVIHVQNVYDVLLVILFNISKHFGDHLRAIRQISKELQKQINTSMDNESLLSMFDLSEVLVYYLDSIEANSYLIRKMISVIKDHDFNIDFANDVLNETEQAKKQAEIYSQIFAGLMDARGTIINNNMNVLIKNLTIINIVFLPLNLIASIGGMSEFSTFTANIPWPISYSAFTLGMVVIGYISYLLVNHSSNKITKKNKQNRLLFNFRNKP